MARVAKADRHYKITVQIRRGEQVTYEHQETAVSLPLALSIFFPVSDVGKNLQTGQPRRMRFEFAGHGGKWPAPNFHTVARDLRLPPHKYDRLFGPTPGEVPYFVRVQVEVRETSALRAYRNSGFLDDDQIDRVAAALVGTDQPHETVLARLYPGLPLADWAEGISAAQFWRVVERDPETNLWRLVP